MADSAAEIKRLDELATRSRRVIYSVRTVFPFDFFPDELTIDENQVSIVHNHLLQTQDIQTIDIPEIKDVQITTSVFFASLTISELKPGAGIAKLEYLLDGDARNARDIIQGLMLATENKVDISTIDVQTLRQKLLEIGQQKNHPAP